ncbi:MAG TPA: hypothetical protein VMW62_03805 [Chloroflexota bacterium]|nr:hypothetical protein [Chloroflexota bacterium]
MFRVGISDQTGNAVVAFAAPVSVSMKYSAVDLASSGGDPSGLTAGYLIDANTPTIVNPNRFPVGSWVFFPPTSAQVDATSGVITVHAQALGGAIAIFSHPVAYVQTAAPNTRLLSSYDPGTSETFGTRPESTYLRVLEPQVGNRLLVEEPSTGGLAYVDIADVMPATKPPPS